jgi:hypothetical protein
MSTLGKALIQIGVLWLHVGVGPMIAMGPMDVRHERRTRNGTRKVAERQCQPIADRAVSVYPMDWRASAVAARPYAA